MMLVHMQRKWRKSCEVNVREENHDKSIEVAVLLSGSVGNCCGDPGNGGAAADLYAASDHLGRKSPDQQSEDSPLSTGD
jgi:hypothetical protein